MSPSPSRAGPGPTHRGRLRRRARHLPRERRQPGPLRRPLPRYRSGSRCQCSPAPAENQKRQRSRVNTGGKRGGEPHTPPPPGPQPLSPTLAKSPGQKGSTFTPAALMSALILSSCNERAALRPHPARPLRRPCRAAAAILCPHSPSR